MKIIFLHHNQPDYLAESLFHGLRTLLGKNCVDVPRYDSMYAPLTDRLKSKLRGNGFTLYGLLEEIPDLSEERFFWQNDIDSYDFIVIGRIWTQWELVWELSAYIEPKKLVVLDGEDHPAFFPYMWQLRKRPWAYFTPVWQYKYFKRELMGEGYSYSLDKFLPGSLRQWIPLPKYARSISFSIPEEKIGKGNVDEKTKDFPTHIVDPEVAAHVNGAFVSSVGLDKYIFLSEKEYYDDLRQSRFGITTKRAGWDCLRHYEIAANGCVPCFLNLHLKPSSCAPHGLNSTNSIVYQSYEDLISKIKNLTTEQYMKLQQGTLNWAYANSTKNCALKFINSLIIPEK